ncbi:MAG: McrC family protein [Gemmatimonadetes bacterium]|nr:McrC family protein [Gemmatimonadota bacterium]MCY3942551.1 McrC family protein [Gemmatimonadota bacterium]
MPTAPLARHHNRTAPSIKVVREYEALTGLHRDDERDLMRFALAQSDDDGHRQPPVFVVRNGSLIGQNYVGIIETRRGTVIEILPKIDLSPRGEEDTRRVFLTMLRDWSGLGHAQLDDASIRAIRRFDMFEAFVHLFLTSVVLLTRRGLARAYRTREANLPRLRGRILFPRHVRDNLVDRSRFYVGYDEFTSNRPANRLIHLALQRLTALVRHPANRQRIHQLRIVFSDVPASTNIDHDWARHSVDRSMRHYDTVMPWVGLFLFGHGLATFSGPHLSRALLFPMEEVFEDFVTASVRRHQRRFAVHAQRPMRHLAVDDTERPAFRLRPDIVLMERGQVRFVLDAKWKPLDPGAPNHGVIQADAYQLFAYGRTYGSQRVVLVYPRTAGFRETQSFQFVGHREPNLELDCFPFDVADAKGSVREMMQFLARRRVTGRREDARRAEVSVSPVLEHRPGVTAPGT